MAYDLHIVRTRSWLDAADKPIERAELDALIAADPELSWSSTDHVDMADEAGTVTRYPAIEWKGVSSFWWYRDQVQCSGPSEDQVRKLVRMAAALGAFAVGDDGERYELRTSSGGNEELVTINDE